MSKKKYTPLHRRAAASVHLKKNGATSTPSDADLDSVGEGFDDAQLGALLAEFASADDDSDEQAS